MNNKLGKFRKKNKWKRREERRLKRLNRNHEDCPSKRNVEDRDLENATCCSNSRRESKPEKRKELLAKSRLTLKPFARNKIHDAMSWPTINIPDSVVQVVEDGVKKMTQEARKIRNLNNFGLSEFRSDSSSGTTSARGPTSTTKEQRSVDTVHTIESSSSVNNSGDRIVNESSLAQIGVTNTEKENHSKTNEERPKSLPNARAWLDTAKKGRDAVTINSVSGEILKPAAANFDLLLQSIAQYHHTGKFMWQGLKCTTSQSGFVMNSTKIKLIGLLDKYNNQDAMTAHSKLESSQEMYWTASENPLEGVEDFDSQFSKGSVKSMTTVPFENVLDSRPAGQPSSSMTKDYLNNNIWGESSGRCLLGAKSSTFQAHGVHLFPNQKPSLYSLCSYLQPSPLNPTYETSGDGYHNNKLACSEEFAWSFDNGWLCRSKQISNCKLSTPLSNQANDSHGKWPFLSLSDSTQAKQDFTNQFQDSTLFIDYPRKIEASNDPFSKIVEPALNIHRRVSHQQRRHKCCSKDDVELDIAYKNISPYDDISVFNKPFML